MRLPAGPRRIVQALSHASYGLYAAGNAVSLTGLWMQRVTMGWLTWELTHSAAWLGLVAFADLIPSAVVSPIGGAAADRWNRLRMTRISQSLSLLAALALAALAWAGLLTVERLLALTVVNGILASFNQPARMALIPSLVPRADLAAAIAVNSIGFNVARFVGPAVAGFVIATAGAAPALLCVAASYGVFLAVLGRLRLPPAAPREAQQDSFGREMWNGLAYTMRHGAIGPLIGLLLAVCLLSRPYVELLPGFVGAVFESGPEVLGLLTAAIGAGGILAGFWLTGIEAPERLLRVALGAAVVHSLAVMAFALSGGLWTAGAALAAAGFSMLSAGVSIQTLMQRAVADEMRGRVMSLYGLTLRCGPALGALGMGWAADRFGFRPPMVAGAGLALAIALAAWAWRHRLAARLG